VKCVGKKGYYGYLNKKKADMQSQRRSADHSVILGYRENKELLRYISGEIGTYDIAGDG
jgi:hypothetical protein